MQAYSFESLLDRAHQEGALSVKIHQDQDGQVIGKVYTAKQGWEGRILTKTTTRHGDVILFPKTTLELHFHEHPVAFTVVDPIFPATDPRRLTQRTFASVADLEWRKKG